MTAPRSGGVHDEPRLAQVLDLDPELGYGLDEEDLAAARRFTVARIVTVPCGTWNPHGDGAGGEGDLGLLVVDGLLKRAARIANSSCAELLGQGDLLRPWQEDAGDDPGPGSEWEALEPVRLAVLDRRFAAAACRWPEIIEVVLSRSVQRSRGLVLHMALSHLTRVDLRLHALFWHLADRWGRVGTEGVVIPLSLTHKTLAHLVGAQRPSVTTGLGALAEAGSVSRRADGGWLLHGDPPAGLRRLRRAPSAAPRGRRLTETPSTAPGRPLH